jgi:hypothetical protein
MGCFTAPHQDQLSSDSCIVLLALHAGKGSAGHQWRIKLLDPGYLGKAADTASADGDRAASEFSSYYTYPLPSDGAAAIATCTSLENACCLHGFEGADMVQGKGEYRIMVHTAWLPVPPAPAGFIPRARARVRGPRGAGQVARAAHGSGGGGLSWRQQRRRP